MPDEPGANPGTPPAASPPANVNPESLPQPTPPGANPDAVPFHQREDLSQAIDYITRQVINRLERRTEVQQPENLAPLSDDANAMIEKAAEKLAVKHKIDKDIAKDVLLENRAIYNAEIGTVKQNVETINLTMRFSGLFAQIPDANQYAPEMKDLFAKLTAAERKFVIESPRGVNTLYLWAKEHRTANTVPTQDRFRGAQPPSNSTPPAQKLGSSDTQVNAALEAFKKKDQAAYKSAVKAMQ